MRRVYNYTKRGGIMSADAGPVIQFSPIINYSVNQVKKIFFRPFHIKKLLIFAFIAWLGAGPIGCNTGINFPGRPALHKGAGIAQNKTVLTVHDTAAVKSAAVVVAVELLLLLPFFIIMTWLSSRFAFIFLHAAVNDTVAIKAPFFQYKKPGNSLFKFCVLYGVILLAAILLVLFPVIHAVFSFAARGAAGDFYGYWLIHWPAYTFSIVVFIGIVITASLVMVFLYDFVVPIMFKSGVNILDAWRAFAGLFKNRKMLLFKYLLVSILLRLCSAVLLVVISLIIAIVLVLAALLLWAVFYFLANIAAGLVWLKIMFYLVMALSFIIFALMFIAAAASATALFQVFFRLFSVRFLSGISPEYAIVIT